jgi:DNA-binding transcriptional ArsR family regulator
MPVERIPGTNSTESSRQLTKHRDLDNHLNMKIQIVFEALSDSTRRRILELLNKRDLTVAEIASHFEITGASLSHHLNKLKAAELVTSKRQGQQVIYSIHTTVFEDMAKFSIEFFSRKGGTDDSNS